MRPGAILATNTSSLMLEPLAAALAAPGRLVGLHFFNPVAQMPLVEVIESTLTRSRRARRPRSPSPGAIDKLPLPCRSAPGLPRQPRADALHDRGHARCRRGRAAGGDRCRRRRSSACRWGRSNWPTSSASTSACTWAGSSPRPSAVPAPDAVAPLVAAGKLGRKTGEGFYVWRDGKAVKPAVDPAYRAPDDLQDRLMLPLVNEAMAVPARGRRCRCGPDRCRRDLRLGLRAVPRRAAALCARTRHRGDRVVPPRTGGAAWRPVPAGRGLGPAFADAGHRCDIIPDLFASGLR